LRLCGRRQCGAFDAHDKKWIKRNQLKPEIHTVV
jgi:hypothetical protein